MPSSPLLRYNVRLWLEKPGQAERQQHDTYMRAVDSNAAIKKAMAYACRFKLVVLGVSIIGQPIPVSELPRTKPKLNRKKYKYTPEQWADMN